MLSGNFYYPETYGVFIRVCKQCRWAQILSYGLNVLEGVAVGEMCHGPLLIGMRGGWINIGYRTRQLAGELDWLAGHMR
jgi:hypothetical protein